MARYSDETRERMVRKMMPPHNRIVASISRETGISAPTLYAWKRRFQEHGYVIPKKAGAAEGWDGKARLAAIVKTASMNEAERSAWCREHGLYPEHLGAGSMVCTLSTWVPGRLSSSRLSAVESWLRSVKSAVSWRRSCGARRRHWRSEPSRLSRRLQPLRDSPSEI